MSTATSYAYMWVPGTVNFSQFTDVQRGTIFIWFFTIFVITIIIGIRVVSGQIEAGRSAYIQNPPASNNPSSANLDNFQHEVSKAQVLTEDDTGSVKMMKTVDKLNTVLMPMLVTFALNVVVGVTYSFALILYFIVLVPLILFNLVGLHKRFFDHKAFICIFQNLWIIFSFFWLLNIWVTGKYQQPYYIYESTYAL